MSAKERDSEHKRRSQWRVVKRCLTILLTLMRQPTLTFDLLQLVKDDAIADESPIDDAAAEKRFEEDRGRLRNWFGCQLNYDHATKLYTLTSIEHPLIDFSAEAVQGMAFLQATFNQQTTPMRREVQALLDLLLMTLPKDRLRDLERTRGVLELNLQQRDLDKIADAVWDKIRRACSEHLQLEFEYQSPGQADGQLRTHVVEPYRYYFDPEGGHYYLDAYRLESRGPRGRWQKEMWTTYRLGRIRDPRLLPTRFNPTVRGRKSAELVYELRPEIARFGVTHRFPNSTIEQQDDGSAIIRTISTDLFSDLRTLLRYGPGCRVLGGEEALREMKTLVDQLHQRYETL